MTFQTEQVDTFTALFERVKPKIEAVTGCHGVDLLQDKTNPCVMFTFSRWASSNDLENYRHSALFKDTWAKTKTLFADKPQAWSTEIVN